MSIDSTKKVKRVLGELAIITLSILLAFSLDAWWSNHQKEMTRRATLETISEELSLAINEIARARSIHEAAQVKLKSWVELIDPNFSGTLSDEEVSTLVPLRQTTADIPISVISRFLNGESIGSIQDLSLVKMLSSWPSLVQDYNLTEESVRYVVTDFKETFRDLSPTVAGLYPALADEYQSRFTPQWSEVMSSFRLENDAYQALNVTTIALSENYALEASAHELIDAIDCYLD